MTLEALLANMKPYDVRLHEVRGFSGAVKTAQNLNKLIAGSDLVAVGYILGRRGDRRRGDYRGIVDRGNRHGHGPVSAALAVAH